MSELLKWISDNPGAFASLASAAIAASIAVIVFALTQFLARKRERAQFLTPKLEALYGLLNEVSQSNATICTLAFQAADGDQGALAKLDGMDHIDLYGHRHAKSIVMYIRLYFPNLSRIHQLLFASQRELNALLWGLRSRTPPNIESLVEAGGQVGHFLRLMEQEIVNNRDALIRDRIWHPRFKRSSQEEIEQEIDRPVGLMWNFRDGPKN